MARFDAGISVTDAVTTVQVELKKLDSELHRLRTKVCAARVTMGVSIS